MRVRIGTSGWSYDHWQGILYPERTPVRKRLAYYVARYDTVEANNTYYRWPPDKTFAGWRAQLPGGFEMAVKAPGRLTHYARLNRPDEWMSRIAPAVRELGGHMGPLLVQLPPRFGYHPDRLERFLAAVPRDIRVAVELRHPSWERDETFHILEAAGAAYCVMSGAHLPCTLRATAPFVYVRFHGPDAEHLYAGSYSDEDMGWWSDRIREWTAQGREVYGYFNNDGRGNALRNADTLKRFLGIEAAGQARAA